MGHYALSSATNIKAKFDTIQIAIRTIFQSLDKTSVLRHFDTTSIKKHGTSTFKFKYYGKRVGFKFLCHSDQIAIKTCLTRCEASRFIGQYFNRHGPVGRIHVSHSVETWT
ncbi:MAG: hypothetical protein A2095_02335 [Sphingomonadales bacterium GWF1_63_6]|nr:MAG: hypothetical protein A2095_02335 [Sphingomonadales bacterium GWF1_63_6]